MGDSIFNWLAWQQTPGTPPGPAPRRPLRGWHRAAGPKRATFEGVFVSRVFHKLEAEYAAWKQRELPSRYVYGFADGTYFSPTGRSA